MPELTFFYQQRYDGGIRIGLGVDDELSCERFEPGKEKETDPALLWYVDVIVEAKEQPEDKSQLAGWFVEHEEAIVNELRRAADKVALGMDASPVKYRTKIPSGETVHLLLSSVRGLAEGELAENLRQLAAKWRETVERITPVANSQ